MAGGQVTELIVSWVVTNALTFLVVIHVSPRLISQWLDEGSGG